MRKENQKVISLIAGGALVVSSVAASPALAEEYQEKEAASESAQNSNEERSGMVEVTKVEGRFFYDQGVSVGNAFLAQAIYQASDYLCRSMDVVSSKEAGEITHIAISGEVENAFSASVAQYQEKHPLKKVMTCTCAGNPADGRASANAEVEGFMLGALIEDAVPTDEANTITFVSEDGYRISMPLSYVMQRYSIIVSTINGEEAEHAVGCGNQLWLGSTSARYFAQNIVGIELSCEETVPSIPEVPKEANQPNVGVLEGA